jgi:hypothetical protein
MLISNNTLDVHSVAEMLQGPDCVGGMEAEDIHG